MQPRSRQGAASTAASNWRAPPSDPWSMPSSSADAPFVTSSPGVDSDHTSDDTGDHFYFEDTLDMVARDESNDFASSMGEGPLPATVEKAISAVYEEITREESAERGGGSDSLWGELGFDDYAHAADEYKEELESEESFVQDTASGFSRSSGAVHRQSTTSSSGSDDATPKIDSGASKRARRSEIEKKSRQRRQGVLRRMRDDVSRLEDIYADLLEKQETSGETDALVRPARRPRSRADLEQMYSRLTALANTLTDEQSHIRRLLQEHALFHQAITSSSKPPELLAFDHGIPVSKSFTAGFALLSVAECYAIVRECHEAICRFVDSDGFISTGASFMGWSDRRKFDEVTAALQYGFQKKYPIESAEQLLLKTWDMFRDEVKMAKLSFDTSVRMKFEVLQTVNDDIYIIRRDHVHRDIPYTFLTVHILFRLQTPDGFTLCIRSIPAPEVQQSLEPHEIYFDVFHWSHFNHIRDEHGVPVGCEVVSGGSIADPTMMVARHWLFELIISVLRWESSCVTPLFIKF